MAVLCIVMLIAFTTTVASQKQMAIIFPDEVPVPIRAKLVASQVGVSSPEVPFSCGKVLDQKLRYSSDDGYQDLVLPYHLNVTADRLRSKGFEVTVTEMDRDEIYSITFSNATFTENIVLKAFEIQFVSGGHNASEERALSLALIGQKKGAKPQWFCGGVLVTHNWVLSAAHCLLGGLTADVIRLGEYDSSHLEENIVSDVELAPYYNQMLDFEIEKIIAHPEFVKDLEQRYHDLVLFKLKKPAPFYSVRIRPICLPWGEPDNLYGLPQSLIGSNVTVTGWGATSYGSLEPAVVLQEVDLEVFDTNVCDTAYQQLYSFVTKYPRGISEKEILCAGAKEGGKDACQGDSGGSLIYQKKRQQPITSSISDYKYDQILAGIVSTGFGCGDKEFPGLYIPVHKPRYLQWIKDVAFDEYQPTNKSRLYDYAQKFTDNVLKVYYEQEQPQINEDWVKATISSISITTESFKQSTANERIKNYLNSLPLVMRRILKKIKKENSGKCLTSEIEEKWKNAMLPIQRRFVEFLDQV